MRVLPAFAVVGLTRRTLALAVLSALAVLALPAAGGSAPPDTAGAAATKATPSRAGAAVKSSKTWTVDDILLAESAGEMDVAPDGRAAVWVRTAMDAKKGESVSNLFLSRLDGEPAEIALTRGKDRHTRPRFSPDGKTIAFLSNRARPDEDEDDDEKDDKATDDEEEKPQIWLVRTSGGEPWPLTKLDREIADFGWKDAETLVVAAAEERSLRAQKVKKAKDTSEVVEDAEQTPPVRLFSVATKDGTLTRLSDGRDWIDWVEVSPDGRFAAARHQQSLSFEYDHKTVPVLKIHDLETGAVRTVFDGRRVLPTGAAWTPDSKGLYVTHSYSSHPTYFTATIELLQYVDAATGTATPVDLQWKNGLGTKEVLPTADGFLALLADGVLHRPARYTRTAAGFTRQDLAGAHVPHVFGWAIGRDGRTVVYDHSKATRPPQLWRARLDGARLADEVVLTTLNAGYAKKPVPRMEVVHWKGARDEEVSGLLHYPIGYQEGKKYPLFLSIHGGPAGGTDMDTWSQGWDYPKLLIAQKGAFQLEVNYHGSSNFGLEWVESICCGNYYDLERVDLEKGVDAVVARGLADPDRLATMGWSNGSILTTELVTRSNRYKVASAGAGDVEWISDWANVDFGASFDNYYFGKAPYEDPELYVRKSPYFRLKDVTTPMIVYTGTDDRNVPPSQSWSHFRVMQQAGRAPVRLVLFPGEPHGLRKYAHQKRKVEEDLAWFDKYLFGESPADEAVKDGSPLAAALERKDFARVGMSYGRTVKGHLVPEAVAHAGRRVSRFEVTRAQYAAFDRKHHYDTATANWPASGITFEKATAYAAWLAALTGEPWRLPRVGEAKDLYATAGDDENTLDAWAGYPPNPEDAAKLREKAKELAGASPLLEEVGRHEAAGESDDVYDLGGNVAEWAVGADGKGVLVGGSADQPAKSKGRGAMAGEAYRGVRVVAGPE
jgi:dipeptidyl aminopeptidase/acylaminoacyl peptidase